MNRAEAIEWMEKATSTIKKLPENWRVLGINLEPRGDKSIQLHVGRMYKDERLEDFAEEQGIACYYRQRTTDDTKEVYAYDENGVEVMQLIWLEERLMDR